MEEKQHDIIEVCRRRKEEFRLPLPVDGWERLEADLKELEKPARVGLSGGVGWRQQRCWQELLSPVGGCGKCRRLNRCRKKS